MGQGPSNALGEALGLTDILFPAPPRAYDEQSPHLVWLPTSSGERIPACAAGSRHTSNSVWTLYNAIAICTVLYCGLIGRGEYLTFIIMGRTKLRTFFAGVLRALP